MEEDLDHEGVLPSFLSPFVHHYHDDFWVSLSFDPHLMAQLMYEGFLPIATDDSESKRCYLLPKCHRQRCCIYPLTQLHLSKTVRKNARKFSLTINTCFDKVIEGCHQQHGIPWLYPPMVEALKAMYDTGSDGFPVVRPSEQGKQSVVRIYSIELWQVENDKTKDEARELCAGELGYAVGNVYTSLTGFSRVSGAGTVQLIALGSLLNLYGYQVWDLGMSIDYKYSLGAKDLPRQEFLQRFHEQRDKTNARLLQELQPEAGGVNARELITQFHELQNTNELNSKPMHL